MGPAEIGAAIVSGLVESGRRIRQLDQVRLLTEGLGPVREALIGLLPQEVAEPVLAMLESGAGLIADALPGTVRLDSERAFTGSIRTMLEADHVEASSSEEPEEPEETDSE